MSQLSDGREQFKIFKTEIRDKITSTGNALVLTVKTYIETHLFFFVAFFCFYLVNFA